MEFLFVRWLESDRVIENLYTSESSFGASSFCTTLELSFCFCCHGCCLLQVKSVTKRHPSVEKISFVSHSLGGLIARYAIGRLYERDDTRELSKENGECRSNRFEDLWLEQKVKGKIAGLKPVNFITSATPHLGSRGHKQVTPVGYGCTLALYYDTRSLIYTSNVLHFVAA